MLMRSMIRTAPSQWAHCVLEVTAPTQCYLRVASLLAPWVLSRAQPTNTCCVGPSPITRTAPEGAKPADV